MSRKLDDLTPECQTKFAIFSAKMAEAGLPFMVTCTGRDLVEQLALWSQGRMNLSVTNNLRVLAGLYQLSAEENIRKVTWTFYSRHIILKDIVKADKAIQILKSFGADVPDDLIEKLSNRKSSNAVDIAIMKDGKPTWNLKVSVNDNDIPDYKEAGMLAKKAGFEWGGDWDKPDYPHLQLKI